MSPKDWTWFVTSSSFSSAPSRHINSFLQEPVCKWLQTKCLPKYRSKKSTEWHGIAELKHFQLLAVQIEQLTWDLVWCLVWMQHKAKLSNHNMSRHVNYKSQSSAVKGLQYYGSGHYGSTDGELHFQKPNGISWTAADPSRTRVRGYSRPSRCARAKKTSGI